MTETSVQDRENFEAFCGYHQNWEGKSDPVLTRTNAGTPCGELLRRYWHPIHMTSELGDRPKLIKVLGEELVLFQDKSGQYGLVHKKCPHRRASLEYGTCDNKGIRCCYHGWLFDVDGTVLEIPGEPEGSKSAANVMSKVRLGAYPVKEFKGLLFAYLGPPAERPEFPFYDAFDIPGMTMTPYAAPFQCNWIQVLDAIVDPVHTAFLHHNQFTEGFGKLGEVKFYHRDDLRFLGTHTRRVHDNIWVRVNELILPNFTQSGAAFSTDGTEVRYFGRSAFTRWVVPLDDESCVAYAWGNFGERGDPLEWDTPEGMQIMEQGEVIDRTYEERQDSPGDVEAVEGMGAISDHEKEYLVSGDRGVALYRNQLRKMCRKLEKGEAPPQPSDLASGLEDGVIPTHGSDTVVNVPSPANGGDREVLQDVNDKVMDAIFDGDALSGDERDQKIISELQAIS